MMRGNKKSWDIFWMKTSVALVVLAMVTIGQGRLEGRDFSAPDCSPPATWAWMDNSQSMNPCKTAAYLQGACHGTTFKVTPLAPGTHYDPGNSRTADSCYCSWATYNLLSACTLCQGNQNGVLPWAQWNSTDCGEKGASTTSPWPVEFNNSIPNHVTFPNWAAKDPRTWTDGRWNAAQASQIASTEFGDYPLATSTPSSTSKPGGGTNAGAIAGGVVGGVVAIAIGVAIAVFLLCRAKRRRAELEKNRDPGFMQHPVEFHHAPSPSDGSLRFYGSNSYAPLGGPISSPSNGSTFLQSPSTFVTHPSDQLSITQDSMYTSIPMTPPPVLQGPSNIFAIPHAQGTVSPFTSQQSSAPSTAHHKKMSEASQGSISNDIPTRLNPPAYTDDRGDFSSEHPDQVSTIGSSSFVTTPSSSAQQTRHEKSPSATSIGSSGTHLTPSNPGYWNQPGSTSFSGAGGLLSSDDLPTPSGPTPSYVAPPPGTIMSVTRSEKSRPPGSAADTTTTQTDRSNADG